MLKRLLLSGTALVALSTMAMAQAATPPGPAPSRPGMTTSAPANTGAQQQQQSKNAPLFTNYKGADVLGSDGKSVGAIADVVVDTQGDVKQLILSHGGVIGIGSTLNAYDVQQMPMLNDGKVKLGLTTASLDQLPKFAYPSGNGNAPAEGRASTSAPASGSTGATAPSPAITGKPGANQSAMNSAASDAASSTAATASSGTMWPVSYIVGADIKKGDKSVGISDARFEGGKLSAVVVNDGTDLGLGKGKQQIAFNQLSISGTPKDPKISLMGTGGSMATPSSSSTAPSAPPAASGTAPTNPAPTSNGAGGSMGH